MFFVEMISYKGGKGSNQCSFFREAFEREKMVEVGIFLGFCHGKGGGCPSPNFLHQKNGNFSGKNNMLRIA